MDLKITNWKAVLETAKLDKAVGIRIAQLAYDPSFCMYVTEIAPKQHVNSHYHNEGIEIYGILEGAGVMHVAKVIEGALIDKQSKVVVAGDFFTIPPHCAHQLENTGETPLILMFGCPPDHLEKDRVMVTDLKERS